MRVIAFFAAALAVAACSSGNGAHPTSTSGGTPPPPGAPPGALADAGADQDAGGDSGPIVCPGPTVAGTDVVAIAYAANAPVDQGGTIANGTYDLTAITIYVGVDGEDPDAGDGGVVDAGTAPRARATLVFGSGTLDSARSDDDADAVTKNAKQHVADVELVVDETCPGSSSQQIPFTAAGDTLTLHTTMTRFETYTRRP